MRRVSSVGTNRAHSPISALATLCGLAALTPGCSGANQTPPTARVVPVSNAWSSTALISQGVPERLRTTTPVEGVDWSGTRLVAGAAIPGKLWIAPWKTAGACMLPLPLGARSVGYFCLSSAQVRSATAVQILEQGGGRSVVIGLARADARSVHMVGPKGRQSVPVRSGVFAATTSFLPQRFVTKYANGSRSRELFVQAPPSS